MLSFETEPPIELAGFGIVHRSFFLIGSAWNAKRGSVFSPHAGVRFKSNYKVPVYNK